MPELIQLVTTAPESLVEALRGRHPDANHYVRVASGKDTDCRQSDGRLLFALFANVRELKPSLLRFTVPAVVRAARPTSHREEAAGDNEVFRNNVTGYLNRKPVAFNNPLAAGYDPGGWRDIQRLAKAMAAAFDRLRPKEFAVLRAAADRSPGCVIPGTPFSTLTANLDATGVHRDDGNLSGGYGAVAVVQARGYSGGLFVLPLSRVAVDLRPGDLLIVDNAEYHGNSVLVPTGGPVLRASLIAYFHSSNLPEA